MTDLHFCSNMEKGKVTRQKTVKKKGPFTDFEEDLIKDLFTRCVSLTPTTSSCCFSFFTLAQIRILDPELCWQQQLEWEEALHRLSDRVL